MPVMKKYPPELKERAVRLVMEARKETDPRGACARVAQQLGIKQGASQPQLTTPAKHSDARQIWHTLDTSS